MKDLGNYYKSFNELSESQKEEAISHFEDDFENSHLDSSFFLKIIPYKKLVEIYSEIYGPNFDDIYEDEYILSLAEDIKKNGLKDIPIGTEGNHRALAHIILEKPMPKYFISSKRSKE